jgi:urea transporter
MLKRIIDRVENNPVFSTILLSSSLPNPITPILTKSIVGRLVIGTLRSIGQVAFVNNAISGIGILVACILSNPPAAILGLISAMLGTAIGANIDSANALTGLHGYNNFLIGMGIGYFGLSENSADWITFCRLVVPTIVTCLFGSIVHICFLKKAPFPPFTFGYNIALSFWLSFAISGGPDSFMYPLFLTSPTPPLERIMYDGVTFEWYMKSTLAGIGQVFFAPSLTSSLIILGSLIIGSPMIGIYGLIGSLVATAIAVFAHSVAWMTEIGLDGFSAVLTCIAFGCFYFVPSISSLLVGVASCIITVAGRYVFSGLLVHPVGPAGTFPFCIVTAFVYTAAVAIGWPSRVHKLDYPEKHLLQNDDFFDGCRQPDETNN